MDSMKLVILLYINSTGQFTPTMKANAEPHLLSSLVRIDSGVVVSQHHLESSFHEVRCNAMTNFMEFMPRGGQSLQGASSGY